MEIWDRPGESGFGPPWGGESSSPPPPPPAPAKADRQKIFTLNRTDWLLVAEWLGLSTKGLLCTVDEWLYYRERQKHMQHSRAPGHLSDCRAPAICTDYTHPPLVGTNLNADTLSMKEGWHPLNCHIPSHRNKWYIHIHISFTGDEGWNVFVLHTVRRRWKSRTVLLNPKLSQQRK